MQDRFSAIPKILKDLSIWCCYDDRDKDYFKDLSDKEINQERKAPRDIKGKKCNYNIKTFTFNECVKSIELGINNGLGISMQNKGLICIDYDNCISDYKIDDKLGLEIPIINDKDRELSVDCYYEFKDLSEFDDINKDGASTGKGRVDNVILDGKKVL